MINFGFSYPRLWTHLVFAVLIKFFSIVGRIGYHFLFQQAVQTRIGFYKSAVYSLTLAPYHTPRDALTKDFLKKAQEYFFAIQLSATADSGMPGQGLIYIVAQKKTNT